MKKITKILLGAMLFAAAVSCVAGCSSAINYPDADKYTAGNAEITESVRNVEVDWLSGTVNVKTHSGSEILIEEEIEEGAEDDLRVHWFVDGSTLRVKYAASGMQIAFNLSTKKKKLTLTLPEGENYESVKISVASAKVETTKIQAKNIKIDSASGGIETTVSGEYAEVSSASGAITVKAQGTVNELKAESASGKIDVTTDEVKTLTVESTSGEVSVKAKKAGKLTVSTTSGRIKTEIDEIENAVKISSTSGKISIVLPENTDFTAVFSSTSGKFNSDFALVKGGNEYKAGTGGVKINISTTSGDASINKKQ